MANQAATTLGDIGADAGAAVAPLMGAAAARRRLSAAAPPPKYRLAFPVPIRIMSVATESEMAPLRSWSGN
jgi:hypothetical protein